MVEPETNETDGSYDVVSGPKEEKKAARKSEMEEAALSSRRMDELASSCSASAISTCNLTNSPFIMKYLKESDHSFGHKRQRKIALI